MFYIQDQCIRTYIMINYMCIITTGTLKRACIFCQPKNIKGLINDR